MCIKRRRADIGKVGRRIWRGRGIRDGKSSEGSSGVGYSWEDEFERGNHIAYRVGDSEEAERPIQFILDDQYDPTPRILRTAVDVE